MKRDSASRTHAFSLLALAAALVLLMPGLVAAPRSRPVDEGQTAFLPVVRSDLPPPVYAWTGEITDRFPNCTLTRVFGFVLDSEGELAGDVWVHYWADGWDGAWAKSQWTAFGEGTPWEGDEGNWDGVLDNRPRDGVWHVCIVPEKGSNDCDSNTVDAPTTSDCENGYQVYRITFRENSEVFRNLGILDSAPLRKDR
jgi:hypothetical protein